MCVTVVDILFYDGRIRLQVWCIQGFKVLSNHVL